ncbi:hypothetical protein Droror1_Dr00024811 [Drosera rotundifolia]
MAPNLTSNNTNPNPKGYRTISLLLPAQAHHLTSPQSRGSSETTLTILCPRNRSRKQLNKERNNTVLHYTEPEMRGWRWSYRPCQIAAVAADHHPPPLSSTAAFAATGGREIAGRAAAAENGN